MNTCAIHTHPLPPFLPKNARVLMLGSFPPPEYRWKMRFYYPNFNNDMWRIFGLLFYADKEYFIDNEHKSFDQPKIERFLTEVGIAISDSAYQVIRLADNASDKYLQVVTPMDIARILQQLPQCQHIITTGEKATEILWRTYASDAIQLKVGASAKLMIEKREIHLHRLPSSSRAYPLSLDKKAEQYRQVFTRLGML